MAPGVADATIRCDLELDDDLGHAAGVRPRVARQDRTLAIGQHVADHASVGAPARRARAALAHRQRGRRGLVEVVVVARRVASRDRGVTAGLARGQRRREPAGRAAELGRLPRVLAPQRADVRERLVQIGVPHHGGHHLPEPRQHHTPARAGERRRLHDARSRRARRGRDRSTRGRDRIVRTCHRLVVDRRLERHDVRVDGGVLLGRLDGGCDQRDDQAPRREVHQERAAEVRRGAAIALRAGEHAGGTGHERDGHGDQPERELDGLAHHEHVRPRRRGRGHADRDVDHAAVDQGQVARDRRREVDAGRAADPIAAVRREQADVEQRVAEPRDDLDAAIHGHETRPPAVGCDPSRRASSMPTARPPAWRRG